MALRVFAPHRPYEFAWAPQFNLKSAGGGWRGKAEYSLPELPGAVPETPLPLFMVEGSIFDGMIRPLIPYAIRGGLWYQGESNVSNPNDYQKLMPLLINGWRSEWGSPDLPFYYFQLANYLEKKAQPGESKWAELREAQLKSLSVSDTGMAVLIDTGESKDIHPQSKDIAGQRLAKIALAHVYGQSIPYSGPIYESMSIEGNRLRLTFSRVEGGLVAQELPDTYWVMRRTGTTAPLVRNSPDSQLEGFAVRGAGTPWVWADAAIDGDTVLVWADDVPHPVEVRYAWADNPTCNLYNQAGLPASPFRADVPARPPESSSIVFSLIAQSPAETSIIFDGATANAATAGLNRLVASGRTLSEGEAFSSNSSYSIATPWISSGVPSTYSGPSMYGGAYVMITNASAASVTVANTTVLRYNGSASPEEIQVSASPGLNKDTLGRQLNFALLFSHNRAGHYGLNAGSVLTAVARTGVGGAGGTQTFDHRWVVVANGVTYVSHSSLGAFPTTASTYTLNNPDEINWAEWNPGEEMSFGSLTYNVPGSLIAGITHAGIAGNYELGVGTGERNTLLSGFRCDLFLR